VIILKKILTKGIIAALAISILVVAGGCGNKSAGKKLVVGTSADYAPYEFHANIDGKDTIVGFDIDIAKEIAKDMGAELEIKDMDFDGLLAALATNKVDMVIAGMTPTEERKQSADFSQIYYTATHGVVMKKEVADQVKSFEDLNGKVVGVQQGTIQADMAKENVKAAKEIKEVPKITDLMLMLQTGKVDAIVMEKPVAESYARTNADIALTSIEVTDETGGSAVAVKKGNSDLAKKVDETIKRLLEEEKIDVFLTEANKLADEQK
jgi:polar amino acid transport system substrate-binding protein